MIARSLPHNYNRGTVAAMAADLFDEEARFLMHMASTLAERTHPPQSPAAEGASASEGASTTEAEHARGAELDLSDQVPDDELAAKPRACHEDEFDEESRFLLHMRSVEAHGVDVTRAATHAAHTAPTVCADAPTHLQDALPCTLSEPEPSCRPSSDRPAGNGTRRVLASASPTRAATATASPCKPHTPVLKPMPPASLPEAALQAIESDNAPKLKQLLQTRGLLEARAPKGRSALWLACYHKSARRRPPARPPSMRPAPTHC
jgi:hypothetical protein